jgi:hypothetical protein
MQHTCAEIDYSSPHQVTILPMPNELTTRAVGMFGAGLRFIFCRGAQDGCVPEVEEVLATGQGRISISREEEEYVKTLHWLLLQVRSYHLENPSA